MTPVNCGTSGETPTELLPDADGGLTFQANRIQKNAVLPIVSARECRVRGSLWILQSNGMRILLKARYESARKRQSLTNARFRLGNELQPLFLYAGN